MRKLDKKIFFGCCGRNATFIRCHFVAFVASDDDDDDGDGGKFLLSITM
jgi:hypothetical protein